MARQGVLLTPDMLEQGIWFPVGGSTKQSKNDYEKRYELRRSENQVEYTAALEALAVIFSGSQHLIAVISMRWCSLTYRLVTSKRVWLGLYHGEQHLITYSHKSDGSPTYNFCDCWENIEQDKSVWRARFGEAVGPALRK